MQPPPGRRHSRPPALPRAGHDRAAWVFLTPFVVLYVLFIIGPAIYMVILSFFDTSLVKGGLGGFAGFRTTARH